MEQAKLLRPDVIVMDVDIPEMDGFEATSLILKDNPVTNTIITSTNTDSGIITKAMLAGVRFFLSKLINDEQIYETIQTLCNPPPMITLYD